MSVLWTEIIDPATLTGYVRASLSDYEARKGTLAVFLPNRLVADTVVRFFAGQAGLVEEAKYRAFDAEPEVGKRPGGKRVTLELPALGQEIPVSEYAQLRGRNASDDALRNAILRTADQVVRAVADRTERMRGVVLATGKATISQDNYKSDDDFGRDSSLTAAASVKWDASTGTIDPLGDLEGWVDTYVSLNGDQPGQIVMSRKAFRAMAANDSFKTVLAGGGSRPATEAEVRAVVTSAGLPDITIYDRRTSAGRVVDEKVVLFAPTPVATDDWAGTELGATFWGQTLTSTDSDFGIADSEQPGVVAGVYRNPKPPMIAEVVSDAIALPVLANANLSAAFTVLT